VRKPVRFPNLPPRGRPGAAARPGGDRFGPRTPPRLRRARAPSALALPPLPLRARSTEAPLRARVWSAESYPRPQGGTEKHGKARPCVNAGTAPRNRTAFGPGSGEAGPGPGAIFTRPHRAALDPPKTRPPPPAATSSQSRRPDLTARPDAPRFGPGASRRTLRAALRLAAEPPGLRRITS